MHQTEHTLEQAVNQLKICFVARKLLHSCTAAPKQKTIYKGFEKQSLKRLETLQHPTEHKHCTSTPTSYISPQLIRASISTDLQLQKHTSANHTMLLCLLENREQSTSYNLKPLTLCSPKPPPISCPSNPKAPQSLRPCSANKKYEP